jgi:hypothetical protein
MGGWVRHLKLKALAKTGFSSGVVIFGLVAALCATVAVFFLIFAAFIWLAQNYSPLTAALVLCGFFLVLTIIGGIGAVLVQRRNVTRAQVELAARGQTPWLDPKMMAVGMQLGRTIGWRKVLPLAAIGFLAAGLAREWFSPGKPDGDGDADGS